MNILTFDEKFGLELDLMRIKENLFYIKEGKKVPVKSALNIVELNKKEIKYLDKVAYVISDVITKVLPILYRHSIINKIFPEFKKHFYDLNKNCNGKGSNVGLDCLLNFNDLSLSILELNYNAVVSLGYMDPLIKIYQTLFGDQLSFGEFRPIGNLIVRELNLIPDKNIFILGWEGSKTYYEELNQVSILRELTASKVKRVNLDEIIRHLDYNSIIKRASSGSFLARFGDDWKYLKKLEKLGYNISNPLIGLAYGSKISLFLLRYAPHQNKIRNLLGGNKTKFLNEVITRTDVVLEGKVYTIEGEELKLEEYFSSYPIKKLVFKDNLGGGHITNVVFGSQLRSKDKEILVQKLSMTKEPIIVQPYLRIPRKYYLINEGDNYKLTKLKDLLRVYIQPNRKTWTAQLCVGRGPSVSFANYSIPIYFKK